MRMFVHLLFIVCFVNLLFIICAVLDAVRCFLNPPKVAIVVQILEDGSTQRVVIQRLGVFRSVVGWLGTRNQEIGIQEDWANIIKAVLWS